MPTSHTFQRSQPDRRIETKTQTEPAYYTAWATLIFAGLWGLTALLGVWAAYDQRVALYRFLQMGVGFAILIGIPLSCGVNTRIRLAWVGAACGGLVGVLGGLVWFVGEGNSGALAGSISVLLPLAIGGIITGWLKQRWVAALTIIPLVIAGLGLFFSDEHSAWLSAAAGLIGSVGFFGLSRKTQYASTQRAFGIIILVLNVCLFAVLWFVLRWPSLVELIARWPLADSTVSRVDLWQNTLTLLSDYPFTGSGLGVSALVYSTYIYLLHVPYIYHAHELFLQIAVEQGLPGLIAFIGMLMTAFYGLLATQSWRGSVTLRWLYSANFGALVALVVYGLQDAEIYVQPTLPLLFVPFGVALALQRRVIRDYGAERAAQMAWDGWLPISAPWLIFVGMMVWPGAVAAMQANLGAVAQTKAELQVYQWPQSKLQDDLRRQHRVDLAPAVQHYRSALALNPENATSYRRLGQIALSEGNEARAQEYLQHVLALNPQDRAARQLLGEIYAISGQIDQALTLWRTIDTGQGQLDTRVWWYNYIGAQREAALFSEALQRLRSERESGE